jgi:predicted O-methyltransferase YrrM
MAARQKLQRAVGEVVADESARLEQRLTERQSESVAALETLGKSVDEVGQRVGAVEDRLNELEQVRRRDIANSVDIIAVQESAKFALEHMPAVPVFWHPHETLRFALGQVQGPGLVLEFGVAGGTTLQIIVEAAGADRRVVGFDTFTGLPETWRTGFPAGEFGQIAPPQIDGAELAVGLFEDTLPGFLAANDGQIAFIHLDADLYSSTKTVLDLVDDRLAPGAVLLFDEFFNFPGWQQHEFRAWSEFVARTGRGFDYLAYTANNEQVVIRLH